MKKLKELDRRYHVFRLAQFGLAGIVGFLALEAILVAGLYAIYGSPSLPSNFVSSPGLLALDVFASVVGVVVGFFVNERTTVRMMHWRKGWKDTLARLAKFEGAYALGSAITIAVQLALLAWLTLSPAVGNIVGAIVAYPVSYAISMRFVWRA
ncbi:MAG TPA: GtrA family protein [Nitrososphaerales archaeon]|nr:GtrA family protein [Nitrososphaerales archaeon]